MRFNLINGTFFLELKVSYAGSDSLSVREARSKEFTKNIHVCKQLLKDKQPLQVDIQQMGRGFVRETLAIRFRRCHCGLVWMIWRLFGHIHNIFICTTELKIIIIKKHIR